MLSWRHCEAARISTALVQRRIVSTSQDCSMRKRAIFMSPQQMHQTQDAQGTLSETSCSCVNERMLGLLAANKHDLQCRLWTDTVQCMPVSPPVFRLFAVSRQSAHATTTTWQAWPAAYKLFSELSTIACTCSHLACLDVSQDQAHCA